MVIASLFSQLKDLIEPFTHLQRDALHVHVGLALFLGLAAVLPSPRRFRKALGWVLVLCLLGLEVSRANPSEGNRHVRQSRPRHQG